MPFVQILVALVCASVFFYKFAIKIFQRDYQGPTKYAVPWSVAFALGFLATFCVVPSVVRGLVETPLRSILPDLDAEYAAKTDKSDVPPQDESVDEENADDSSTSEDAKDASLANQEIEPKEEKRNPDEIQVVEQERSADDGQRIIEIELDAPNPSDAKKVETEDNSKIATQHPMSRLRIRSYKTSYFNLVVALFFISVVLVAPVLEEFVFRVVIQGLFETRSGFGRRRDAPDSASDGDARARNNVITRILIVCVSQAAIFAILHVGSAESEEHYTPMNMLLDGLIAHIVSAVVILWGGLAVLRRLGAKPGDLGLGEDFSLKTAQRKSTCLRLVKEWLRGVYLQMYATPVLLFFAKIAQELFPGTIVAPIPIFFFALYEGYVYFKTRSYPTVVGMHMTLNFVRFTVLYCSVLNDLF